MLKRLLTGVMLTIVPAVVLAQEGDLRERVKNAQPVKYESSDCYKTGHFSVRGATSSLKTASENEVNRDRLLGDAYTSLTRAILERGQEENPGAWFYLGRTYLYQGDVLGADSALARAEELKPECANEAVELRQRTWRAITEAADLHVQENRVDSAIATYRYALAIYRAEARAYSNMGSIFELAGQPDSALVYFRNAANMNTEIDGKPDPEIPRAVRRMAQLYAEAGNADSAGVYLNQLIAAAEAANDGAARDAATSALGRIMFQAQRYPEALAAFKRLAEWNPEDDNAKRNLASIYQAAGHEDSARAILADLGVAVTPRVDTTSAPFLINRGAGKYREGQFQAAAADFEQALTVDPSNRVALVNLALAYNELKDGAKLVETAKRSIARDPFHELSHRFLVQGHVFLEENDLARAAVAKLEALPITVDSVVPSPSQDGLSLNGVAMGRDKGPSDPMVLLFEFLGADGAVIATGEVPLESLAPGAVSRFVVVGQGSGIVDWRYRKK